MERSPLSITLSLLVLFSSFSLLAQSNAYPDLFTRTGSKLTFVATTPDKGTELWSSGGSTATTAIPGTWKLAIASASTNAMPAIIPTTARGMSIRDRQPRCERHCRTHATAAT